MAKRFKLRMSRVLQSCRSKDPSSLPSNPVPSFLRLSPVDSHKHNPITVHFKHANTCTATTTPPAPNKSHHHSSFKRHVSSAFSSIGCGLRSRTSDPQYSSESDHTESPPPPPTPRKEQDFQWVKEEKFHVIAKTVFEDEDVDDTNTKTPRRRAVHDAENGRVLQSPPPPPPNTERKKRRSNKKKKRAPKFRFSTSSADDSGLFSSSSFDDDNNNNNSNINDEETEALVSSSRSFSTDESSSEFNVHLETIREAPSRRKKFKKAATTAATKRCVLKKNRDKVKRELFSAPECEESSPSPSPARLSMFLQRWVPCTVDGKVRESFAVVKRSQDPYEDFKGSMMEMILEKQMFEEKDLEQLLHCFLSLNSRHHHGVIVQAFAEIWQVLFCSRRSTSTYCQVPKAT